MKPRHGAPIGLALAVIGFGVLLTMREAGVIDEDVSILWITVTAIGFGMLVAVFSGRRPGAGLVVPLVLLAIGGTELLKDTGTLDRDFSVIPPVIVAVGLGMLLGGLAWRLSAPRTEDGAVTKRIPLGGASEASVRIRHEEGELRVDGHRDPSNLVEGRFEGGVREEVHEDGDRIDVRLEPPPGRLRRNNRWDVRLKPGVTLDLEILGGSQRLTADLSTLLVRSLLLATGNSTATATLPERGRTSARIHADQARVEVRIPQGMEARIKVEAAQSRCRVDETRFPRVGDVFRSAAFETAGDRIELELAGTRASFSVR